MKNFIPAWKDKEGNHLMFLAKNHIFDTRSKAVEYQNENFIFFIPYGITPDGIEELELQDGKGGFVHVVCDGPMDCEVAVTRGPIFDREVERSGCSSAR